MDEGGGRFALRLDGLRLRGGGHTGLFRGADVHPPGRLPHRVQYPQAGRSPPLGFFDENGSGLLRSRLDGAAAETETLPAHDLADIVGTVTMFPATLALMLVFD